MTGLDGVIQLHGAGEAPVEVDWLRRRPGDDPTVVVRVGAGLDALRVTLYFDDPSAAEAWAMEIVEQARSLAFGAEVEAVSP